MNATKLNERVKRQPFEPFRMHLSNGITFDVRHPDMIVVTQRDVVIAVPTKGAELAETYTAIDPLHITHVEPIPNGRGHKNGPTRKPKKKS